MVEAGQVLWHDAVRPVLGDGRYQVTLTPTLAVGAAPAAGALDVLVGGPPPDPGSMRSVPAAGAGDVDDEALPFVLLERRTLPWERAGFGRPGVPWLALVLTRDDEATLQPAGADQGPSGQLTCTDAATQTRLLPRPDDVPLLAHVREQPGLPGDDDGWQAVVVANRVPRAAGAWRMTLVALDGRADLLGGAPRLGLAALWSATFTVGGTGMDGLAAIRPTRFADPVRLGATGTGLVDDDGAVAVQTRDLAGATSPGRLRSPLRPALGPVADDDLTELTAESLGRLLALADPRLLADLTAWHRARQQARTRATLPTVAQSEESLPVAVARLATRRWQQARLPVAGARGGAAVPVRPGVLHRITGGGWG